MYVGCLYVSYTDVGGALIMIVTLDATLRVNKKHHLSKKLRLRIGDSEWVDLFSRRWSGPVAIVRFIHFA